MNRLDLNERYYDYISDLDDNTQKVLKETILTASKAFCISNLNDGETIASEVRSWIDRILETGTFPEEYESLDDVCIALGALYGHSLNISYGWSWEIFGETEEESMCGVVSPEKKFCNPSFNYIYSILIGSNYGSDVKKENTVLLSYNMMSDIDKKPMHLKYYPIL
ncbi:hypothetical protein DV092_12990 [Clostridium botulinum]|uniref:hypothetical protein n=1 Tax=Clostridium sp. ZBS20 TaxID=2949966 RepID=UPI002079BBE6|nr:hypothetical protein [Clostridium sp. ZBS20]MBN1052947.1 hypothetical protein [Clostridium botulinum]